MLVYRWNHLAPLDEGSGIERVEKGGKDKRGKKGKKRLKGGMDRG